MVADADGATAEAECLAVDPGNWRRPGISGNRAGDSGVRNRQYDQQQQQQSQFEQLELTSRESKYQREHQHEQEYE